MPTTLSFHETLQGAFAWGQTDPKTGAMEGDKAGITFGFDGTIEMDDLDRFISDPDHTASFGGTYLGNLFESRGLPKPEIVSGIFNFMAPGPGAPRLMIHVHTLRSGNDLYTLRGTKYLEGDPLACHTVGDLTTLYTTLEDAAGKIVAAGVLHFPMSDFLDLVTSFKSSGDDDPLTAKMKFLKLFLHEEVYVLLTGYRPVPVPGDVRRALAKPPATRRDSYDVVIIGSGYGGGSRRAVSRRPWPGARSEVSASSSVAGSCVPVTSQPSRGNSRARFARHSRRTGSSSTSTPETSRQSSATASEERHSSTRTSCSKPTRSCSRRPRGRKRSPI